MQNYHSTQAPSSPHAQIMAPPAGQPHRCTPCYNAIPAELKARPQWVVWRWQLRKSKEPHKSKWTKIPYNPSSRGAAKPNDPTTWSTYDSAVRAFEHYGYDGIGYVFTDSDPYVGIDLDECIDDTGALAPWAMQIVSTFDTYTEISPSGHGLKLIARGTMPEDGTKHGQVEIYRARHYFTITGHQLVNTPTEIRTAQVGIDRLYHTIRTRNAEEETQERGAASSRAVERPPAGSWAAQHSDAEWDEARRRARTVVADELGGDPSALPRGISPNSQTGLVLRGEYEQFHVRWAFVGILRADGTPDDHMLRAVVADGLKGRGYSFPRYAALMDHYFGTYCREKWHNSRDGGRAAWREELARLWARAKAPTYIKADTPPAAPAAAAVEPGRRGRPWLDRAERQRAAILAALAATPADEHGRRLIDSQALAREIGTSQRMAQIYLTALERDGEIKSERIPGTRRRCAILVERRNQPSECPRPPAEISAKLNQHAEDEALERTPTPETANAIPCHEETHMADPPSCVSSTTADFASLPVADAADGVPLAPEALASEPDSSPVAMQDSDSLPAPEATVAMLPAPQRLVELVREALDAYGSSLKRVQRYVADTSDRVWSAAAVERTYRAELERRQRERQAAALEIRLRAMRWSELKRRAGAAGVRAADLRRRGEKSAGWWNWYAGQLEAEISRRLEAGQQEPEHNCARRRRSTPSVQLQQHMMLDLVMPVAEFEPEVPSLAGEVSLVSSMREVARDAGEDAGGCALPSLALVLGERMSADDLCAVLGSDPAYTAWAHERFQELLTACSGLQ